MRLKIIEGFLLIGKNDPFFYGIRNTKIPVIETHITCGMNNSTENEREGTTISSPSHFEVKQKLSNLKTDSKVLKFFEENNCSICLRNYKEIIDEDNHIVVQSCGHPMCCVCADNLLKTEEKKCPRCRQLSIISAELFKLMEFNEDLEVDFGNQNVYF